MVRSLNSRSKSVPRAFGGCFWNTVLENQTMRCGVAYVLQIGVALLLVGDGGGITVSRVDVGIVGENGQFA